VPGVCDELLLLLVALSHGQDRPAREHQHEHEHREDAGRRGEQADGQEVPERRQIARAVEKDVQRAAVRRRRKIFVVARIARGLAALIERLRHRDGVLGRDGCDLAGVHG